MRQYRTSLLFADGERRALWPSSFGHLPFFLRWGGIRAHKSAGGPVARSSCMRARKAIWVGSSQQQFGSERGDRPQPGNPSVPDTPPEAPDEGGDRRAAVSIALPLSASERATLLRSLDPTEPVFVNALRYLQNDRRTPALALELAVVGNEMLARLRGLLQSTGASDADAAMDAHTTMLACDTALRAGLVETPADRSTIEALLLRARELAPDG